LWLNIGEATAIFGLALLAAQYSFAFPGCSEYPKIASRETGVKQMLSDLLRLFKRIVDMQQHCSHINLPLRFWDRLNVSFRHQWRNAAQDYPAMVFNIVLFDRTPCSANG
jgi:hypothetical protein